MEGAAERTVEEAAAGVSLDAALRDAGEAHAARRWWHVLGRVGTIDGDTTGKKRLGLDCRNEICRWPNVEKF